MLTRVNTPLQEKIIYCGAPLRSGFFRYRRYRKMPNAADNTNSTTLKVMRKAGSRLIPLPSSAKMTVWGMYPIVEPVMKAIARALDTPATRLVIKLLPRGKRRISSVIANVLSFRNVSAFFMRLEKRFETILRPIKRAKKNEIKQPIAVAARARKNPRFSPKAYPPRKETTWRGRPKATNNAAPARYSNSPFLPGPRTWASIHSWLNTPPRSPLCATKPMITNTTIRTKPRRSVRRSIGICQGDRGLSEELQISISST